MEGGELHSDIDQDQIEKMAQKSIGSPWEDGEQDYALYCNLKKFFDDEDTHKMDELDEREADIKEELENPETTESEKKKFLEMLEVLTRARNYYVLAGKGRKIPSLKVLSAIAVCKKHKESAEMVNPVTGGRVIWKWKSHKDCNGSCEDQDRQSDRRCGFCRFAKWIKEQAIPREVKSYCKNVLHYLGSRNFDFIDDGVIDDEDMFESDDSYTIGEPSEDEDVSSAGSLFASTEEEEDEEEEQGE